MAAGGKGAPLVPFLDYIIYRDAAVGRIVQNLGGIANLTAIPARASPEDVVAFDTGPGNMVVDAVMERLYCKPYDRDGQTSAKGKQLEPILKVLLQYSFFRRRPPKTAGREEFGQKFVADFLRRCRRARKEDVVATATALTARSISRAIKMITWHGGSGRSLFSDYIISGGGAKNRTLVDMLRTELEPLGLRLRSSDDFGIPSTAKEAVAFALLAHETWHRRPSNIPSATGARRPAILGKISYAS